MELERGLIISCQAAEGEPLHGLGLMSHFAHAAVLGGAVGIRALCEDIESIKKQVDVPIIGLVKKNYPGSSVYITPTIVEVDALIASGCDCIALDATMRPRHGGVTLEQLVSHIRNNAPAVKIMADIAIEEEAKNAERLGFDYIGTTLYGYTEQTNGLRAPNYKFIKRVTAIIKNSKVIVEGGIWETKQIKKVVKLNPYAIVIGSAITRPSEIVKRFSGYVKL
ncbi:MAG: N-acetylmannosamine-6-phosphate 2-epimerase [Firmicutes bacterium]|nr:N-acetylmannosamine-6-phosphate 2-epimerase [Bacillota bacterium]